MPRVFTCIVNKVHIVYIMVIFISGGDHMRINIAVCDDENAELQLLQKAVRQWADSTGRQIGVSLFDSAEAFIFAFEGDNSFDILLLDIQMKKMDGIALAKRLRESDERLQIVFITGYPDYISEGYEVSALHYLIKPVDIHKLREVLDRACHKLRSCERTILLPSAEGNVRVPAGDILYAEVFSHDVQVYTTKGPLQIRLSMSQLEQVLGDDFFRCHRSYIAGLKHVCRVSRSGIQLDNGKELPVSRKLYDRANQAFIKYNWGDTV